MKRVLVILVLFWVSFAGWGWALQAIDAENGVVNGHYLEEGERAAVFKALPQTNGSQKYWLVSVLENDALRTIMPLADKDSKLVNKSALRTSLISANLLIQRLNALKTSIPWLISLSSANKLEELSVALQNEQFDLDIVAESLTNASVKSDVLALKNKLSGLTDGLHAVAEEIKALNADETSLFNATIDTGKANALPGKYESVYLQLEDIYGQATNYDTDVAKVKNRVATLNELDSGGKQQLIGLLSPLGQNQSVTSAVSPYTDLGVSNQQRVTTENASIPTKVAALEAELDVRLLRSQAFLELYEEDEFFRKQTNFLSLEEAIQTMLAEENVARWKDQSNVTKLQATWGNATSAFEKKQYTIVIEFGQTAKSLVKQIKSAGILPVQNPNQQLADALISGLALVLGGIAAVMIGKTAWKYFGQPKQ